jgi:hypothetical protein
MNLNRKKITTSSLIRWSGLPAMVAGISASCDRGTDACGGLHGDSFGLAGV